PRFATCLCVSKLQTFGRNLRQAKKIQVEANFFLCPCAIRAWRTRRGGRNYCLNPLQEITRAQARIEAWMTSQQAPITPNENASALAYQLDRVQLSDHTLRHAESRGR